MSEPVCDSRLELSNGPQCDHLVSKPKEKNQRFFFSFSQEQLRSFQSQSYWTSYFAAIFTYLLYFQDSKIADWNN